MLTPKDRLFEVNRPLNQRLELWHPTLSKTIDELGATVDAEGLVCKLWANVSVWRGVETSEVGRVVPYLYYKIVTRYSGLIEPSMYFVYRGKALNINSINNVCERNLYLELACTERVTPSG